MSPKPRSAAWEEPSDIADAVALLASEDGRWITGKILELGGGLAF